MRILSQLFPASLLILSIVSSQLSAGPVEELQEYERAAKARGVRWKLAEYRPARVPAADDAALLPVFASPNDYEALLEKVPVLTRKRGVPSGVPAPIDWKATRHYSSPPKLVVDPAEPDDVRALDAAMRPFQPLIEQLCESKATAANWGDEVWVGKLDAQFKEAMPLFRCASLLKYRANLDLALGRPADARRAIEAQLRLARVASRTPPMILHLFSLAMLNGARETMWLGVQTGAWDDETLRAFAIEFLGWNTVADFLWSFETERAWAREVGEQAAKDPAKNLEMLLANHPEEPDPEEMRKLVADPVWRARNDLWTERSRDEVASMLNGPSGTWQPVERKFDAEKLSLQERKRDLAACCSNFPMHVWAEKAAWLHAQNQMAAIGCALEVARRKDGKYPDRLDSLAPAILPRIPLDPVNGEPFRYRIEPNGSRVLYSVGFDRKDDGGKFDPDVEPSAENPDWAWFAP